MLEWVYKNTDLSNINRIKILKIHNKEYALEKLDNKNLYIIEVNNIIYYVVIHTIFIYVFWSKDFSKEKVNSIIYKWLDLISLNKIFIDKFNYYFDDNILLKTPLDDDIILNTYWMYIIPEVLENRKFALKIHLKKINNLKIKEIDIISIYENDIRKYIESDYFRKTLNLSKVEFLWDFFFKAKNTLILIYNLNL